MLFSGSTSLAKVLQIRPAVLELLEATRKPFWDQLHLSVEAFCQEAGVGPVEFLKHASTLAVPSAAADFAQEPLYRVLDYLTADHREFLEKDLPEIKHLLDVHSIPNYPDGYVLKLVQQAFQPFAEKFRDHMLEEEQHVFPHILRLESSERLKGTDPMLHRGSVRAFAAMQNHTSEAELKHMITDITEKVRNHRLKEPTAAVTEEVHTRLSAFEQRLMAHAALESDILFPRAAALEQRLFDLRFEGKTPPSPFSSHT